MSYLNSTRRRPNKATYWAPGPPSGYGSQISYIAPREIRCRWEQVTDEELSVAYKVSGETNTSRSIVYCNEPLELGGYLFFGASTKSLPAEQIGAFPIRAVSAIPSVSGGLTEYAAYL
jgi:hypothetical protein